MVALVTSRASTYASARSVEVCHVCMHLVADPTVRELHISTSKQGNNKCYCHAWGGVRAACAQRMSVTKGAYVPACGGREARGEVYGMNLFPCTLEPKACIGYTLATRHAFLEALETW